MSEVCGLDKLIPKRDRSLDYYPMKYDFIIIPPGAKEVWHWNQLKGEFLNRERKLV
jgi:hypothetical protein